STYSGGNQRHRYLSWCLFKLLRSKMTVKDIFPILEKAKISLVDFQTLTDISRTTLYNWKDGKPATDRLRVNFALTMAARVEKALDHKKLPLKNKLKKDERIAALRRIIKESSI
ncbi:MAG: hypothetical protein JSV82_05945, partial [Planctomycetota bacterium]